MNLWINIYRWASCCGNKYWGKGLIYKRSFFLSSLPSASGIFSHFFYCNFLPGVVFLSPKLELTFLSSFLLTCPWPLSVLHPSSCPHHCSLSFSLDLFASKTNVIHLYSGLCCCLHFWFSHFLFPQRALHIKSFLFVLFFHSELWSLIYTWKVFPIQWGNKLSSFIPLLRTRLLCVTDTDKPCKWF